MALALFVPSAFLDYLDGHEARRLDQVSPFGAFLDVACDWIVLIAYFAVMFSAHVLPIFSFSLLMLAVSLLVLAHLARFFSQGSSTAEREITQVSVSSTGTISTVLAYCAGAFGVLDGLFPSLSPRFLRLDRSIVLLFVSVFSTLFALLYLYLTLRSPSRRGDTPASHLKVHGSEPLFLLLLERFRLGPAYVFLCYELFLTMPLFLTAMVYGIFFENGEYKGIFWIRSQLWGYGLILPLVLYFATDFYISAPAAINSLKANRMISDELYDQFVKRANSFYHEKAYVGLVALVTVIAEIWFRFDMVRNHVHTFVRAGHLSPVECLETFAHMVSTYFVLSVLVNGTATLVVLTQIFKKSDFTSQVFHHDRYVGIKTVVHLLTDFSNIVLLVLVEFILTISDAIRLHLPPAEMHLVVFGFGLVALPILTLIPIWVVHDRLIAARQKWMEQLNNWFQAAYKGDASNPDSLEVTASVPYQLTSFEKADGIKRAIERIPTWPIPAYKVGVFLAKMTFTLVAFAAAIVEIVR